MSNKHEDPLKKLKRKELRNRIENAMQSMSETARSWEQRCYSIMAALGCDYGDYSEELPDVGSWAAVNQARSADQIHKLILEKYEVELERDAALAEVARLKTAFAEPVNPASISTT